MRLLRANDNPILAERQNVMVNRDGWMFRDMLLGKILSGAPPYRRR